jgi:AcrR family transcriptional regulator
MTDQTPSKRRYQKTRQEILDAASAIIIEQGVNGLSMRALAEKVDYSAPALYKYFKNKDEIISALREEGVRLSNEITLEMVQPDMDLKQTMVNMGMGYIEFARRYPAHYQLIMSPSDIIPNNFVEFLNDPQFGGLLGFTKQALESGQIKLPEGYDAVHLAFLMWFVGHGAATIQNTVMQNCMEDFSKMYLQLLYMLVELI